MPARFEAVYTDEQRDAIATAYEDRRIRPARRVVELAEAGELVEGLAPFTVHGGANTVRDMARKRRQKRAGQLVTETAKQPPRDALEALRRRLLSAIDHELTACEREQKKRAGSADPERLRQIGRALREAAAIPTPSEPTPPKPGHGPMATRTGSATRGASTVAGRALLADVEAEHDVPPSQPTVAETDPARVNDRLPDVDEDAEDAAPGSWAREQIATIPGIDPRLIPSSTPST